MLSASYGVRPESTSMVCHSAEVATVATHLQHSRSADNTLLGLPLSDYEDKAAERHLDLRRERNLLESAVQSQKDTKHGEFAQLALPVAYLTTLLSHTRACAVLPQRYSDRGSMLNNHRRSAMINVLPCWYGT